MTMHDSQIITAIAADPYLRERIDGVVTKALGTKTITDTERRMLDQLDRQQLANTVAGNPSILIAVRDHLAEAEDQIGQAIQLGVTDSDLTYIVLNAVTFLQ